MEENIDAKNNSQSQEPLKFRPIKPLSYEDRKNSSSDLHSRLKTRKVLGVGEIRDDGDIYRSKISQILGHSEHLYIKLPRGLFFWQATHVAYFFGSGLLCIVLPRVATWLEMFSSTDAVHGDYLPVRFNGCALIGLSIFYRGLMLTRERSYISNGLLGSAVIFGLQILISLPRIWSNHSELSNIQLFGFISKILLGIIGNYVYYEILRSSSSSIGLSRLIRKFGFFLGLAAESMTGAQQIPSTSTSNIYFSNTSDSVEQEHKTNEDRNSEKEKYS